jgi:hypothetical protein
MLDLRPRDIDEIVWLAVGLDAHGPRIGPIDSTS